LRQSEERYRTLFESMNQGFCIVEVLFEQHRQPFDYRFLLVNPAYERQTGLTNVVGRTLSEVILSHLEYWPQIYGQIAVTGQPQRFERRAEGLNRTYEVAAWRVGERTQRRVVVLFNDISERKSNHA
jgi:PAS domain S-box-containing protein